MTTMHTREFFEKNFERFINTDKNQSDYFNLEEALDKRMAIIADAGLDADSLDKTKKVFAKQIADDFRTKLNERMGDIRRLESGEASLGHTTRAQEISEMNRLVTRFEFNCYQLSLFKQKYLSA